jgi:hypothetical protein
MNLLQINQLIEEAKPYIGKTTYLNHTDLKGNRNKYLCRYDGV